MSDLLSQDEIDALLHGVDDVEEEEVSEAPSDASALEYDFSSQDRIVRGRMPTLEIVNERFARHLRVSLFNMMASFRRSVDKRHSNDQVRRVHSHIVCTYQFEHGEVPPTQRYWTHYHGSTVSVHLGG